MRLTTTKRSPLSETLQKGKRLLSPRTGIIRYLYEFPCDPDAPQIFGFGAITTDTSGYGFKTSGSVSGSTSIIRERAIAGALGEAIERYSAAFVPTEEMITAPYRTVEGIAIDPRSLVLYSDQQYELPGFRYRRFDDEDLVRWVEGYSLTREKPVLVPAFATYIPYTRDEKEHPYVQQITTGLACGNTLEEAILSGIGEVVERDATMMTWLGGLSRPRLSVDFAPNTLAGKTFARFGALRDKVVLIDISTDIGIPVVVAVSLAAHSAGPAAVFASKASLQPEQAVVGALDELAQCIVWVRGLMREEPRPAPKEMTDVDSIEDHVLWPAFPENRHHHEFMWSSPDVRNCTDLPSLSEDNVTRDIHKAVSLLERVGLEVVVVDVTAPDVRDAGFHVVRVIIPNAQPLYFGSHLYRVSDRLRKSKHDIAGVQYRPHPFP